MFLLNNPFDSFFNLQRDFDRMFNQFWADLPARTTNARSSFQVRADESEWRIDVPLPGVDPKDVSLEAAGNTLTVRVGQNRPDGQKQEGQGDWYEQTLTIPQFLDLERVQASHHHGMLRLTVPVKESVKPRRIQISAAGEERRQLADDTRKDERRQTTAA